MTPRFTVVLPAYNGGAYLRKAIGSLLAQTCPDFEVAVLDDASTDGSLEWLESLGDARIRIHRAPERLGIERNWARALELPAEGFMTFLGQDDLYDPHFLQVLSDLIRREPRASLYHAHHRIVDSRGAVTRACAPLPPVETAAEWLAAALEGRYIHATGYAFRAEDYRAVGGIPLYDTLMFADYALWLQLARRGCVATAEAECFSLRRHRASASAAVDGLRQARAFNRFSQLLADLQRQDPELGPVIARSAPDFALRHARHAYRLELDRANLDNRPARSEVLRTAEAALRRLAPGREAEILQEYQMARRSAINAHPAKRLAYSLRRRVLP